MYKKIFKCEELSMEYALHCKSCVMSLSLCCEEVKVFVLLEILPWFCLVVSSFVVFLLSLVWMWVLIMIMGVKDSLTLGRAEKPWVKGISWAWHCSWEKKSYSFYLMMRFVIIMEHGLHHGHESCCLGGIRRFGGWGENGCLKALRGNAMARCCLCCGGLERQNALAIWYLCC